MIRIHKENREILTGSLKYVTNDYNVIGYGRFNRESAVVVVVNNNDYEVTRDVCIWPLGIPRESLVKRLMLTWAEGFTTKPEEYQVAAGKVRIVLPGTSAIVLKYEKAKI